MSLCSTRRRLARVDRPPVRVAHRGRRRAAASRSPHAAPQPVTASDHSELAGARVGLCPGFAAPGPRDRRTRPTVLRRPVVLTRQSWSLSRCSSRVAAVCSLRPRGASFRAIAPRDTECRTGYFVERLTLGRRRLNDLMAGVSSRLRDELRALLSEMLSDISLQVTTVSGRDPAAPRPLAHRPTLATPLHVRHRPRPPLTYAVATGPLGGAGHRQQKGLNSRPVELCDSSVSTEVPGGGK